MFKFFERRHTRNRVLDKSCENCINFDKKNVKCKATNNSTLKSFPFKNTNCKTYKQK